MAGLSWHLDSARGLPPPCLRPLSVQWMPAVTPCRHMAHVPPGACVCLELLQCGLVPGPRISVGPPGAY